MLSKTAKQSCRRGRPGDAGVIHGVMPRSPGRPAAAGSVADRLREAMSTVRPAEAAAAAGISTAALYRYFKGRPPSVEAVAALCARYGLSADWLLLGRGPRRCDSVERWALETAGPAELCEAIGWRLEAGDTVALRELAVRMGVAPPEIRVRATMAAPVTSAGRP